MIHSTNDGDFAKRSLTSVSLYSLGLVPSFSFANRARSAGSSGGAGGGGGGFSSSFGGAGGGCGGRRSSSRGPRGARPPPPPPPPFDSCCVRAGRRFWTSRTFLISRRRNFHAFSNAVWS